MAKTPNIYKPKTLPQISAPFTYVAHELNQMGQPYQMVGVDANSINPSQAFVDGDIVTGLLDKLKSGGDLKAIWLDKDNNNLDGHHTQVAHMLNKNSHIPAVRLACDRETAVKVLQEIQSKYDKENNSKFLNSMREEDAPYSPEGELETEKKTIKAYRKKPIVEKSTGGNFFALKEVPDYKPYEIELESVLNTNNIDKAIMKDKNPPLALAKIWFPTMNFEEKAVEMGMNVGDFINTLVAEKARTKGIDGIEYGDKLLQTID